MNPLLAAEFSSVFGISFAVYTLVIVGVGVLSARRGARSDEDYFLAGRSLGPWIAALSASASSESGWVTIGLVGWAFQQGVIAYWIIPGCLIGYLFNWFVLAKRVNLESQRTGALTIPEMFARRFGERLPILRVASVIVIMVAMLLYVAAQFAAAGKSFEASFDIDYRIGVLIGAAVVLAYTVIGGFRAACWTDLLQGIVMVGTLVVFPLSLIATYGGLGFLETQFADHPELLQFWPEATGLAFAGFLLGSGALGINLGFPGQPHILVRFMAMRDPREIRLAGVIAAVWGTGVFWGAVTVGLMVRAITMGGAEWTMPMAEALASGAPDAGERGLVLAAINLLPGALSGMALAGVLAAICSTADSQLVVAASAGAHDVFGHFRKGAGRAQSLVNRGVVMALGVIAVLLVIDEEVNVYTYVLDYGWATLGAAFGPQLILALLWKRATYAGCVAGMMTGFAAALLWNMAPALEGIYNLTGAFVLALVVNAAVSAITAPKRP
ncbi:MAG: sodium/proline symporter [Planctomycetota bacterium]|jgi:sodium/proline symporter